MKKILIILCFLMCMNVKASITVMDGETNRILFSTKGNEKKLIASTTKIMTCIVALEYGDLSKKVSVSNIINTVNGSMIYIKEGEVIKLYDLLYGLMLRSGNDAAVIIAENIYGYDDFVSLMNKKALELGMYNTHFENPHGLNDESSNYSTSNDLAILMSYAIKNKEFLKITSTKKYKCKSDSNEYIWYNKNKLLSTYKYTISGKIGYTKKSGQVFVSSALKDNKLLIISSIDEDDKFTLHKNLYEKYFNLYNRYKLIDEYNFSINDEKYNNYYFYINSDVNMLLTKNEYSKLKINAKLNSSLSNNDAGYLEFNVDNKTIYRKKLYYIEYNERKNKIKNIISN